MAIKDQASEILRRLEEGTDEIYSRYEQLIRASDAGYDQKIQNLNQDYYDAANRISAQARIDLKNTLEKMADNGYMRSGETLQARLSANASRNASLSALNVQKARDTAGYETQKSQAALTLRAEQGEALSNWKSSMMKAYQEQLNRDREFEIQQRKAEEDQKKAAAELELARQKVALEQQKLAATTKKSAGSQSTDNGFTPSKNVYDYLNDIVKQNTTYNPKGKYYVINKKAIYSSLYGILQDQSISNRYRYELYLYSKSMGYIPES